MPPLHVHHDPDETFHVLEGRLSLHLPGQASSSALRVLPGARAASRTCTGVERRARGGSWRRNARRVRGLRARSATTRRATDFRRPTANRRGAPCARGGGAAADRGARPSGRDAGVGYAALGRGVPPPSSPRRGRDRSQLRPRAGAAPAPHAAGSTKWMPVPSDLIEEDARRAVARPPLRSRTTGRCASSSDASLAGARSRSVVKPRVQVLGTILSRVRAGCRDRQVETRRCTSSALTRLYVGDDEWQRTCRRCLIPAKAARGAIRVGESEWPSIWDRVRPGAEACCGGGDRRFGWVR